jgi:DNA invertase Pin-like site-specific DNA recombinase
LSQGKSIFIYARVSTDQQQNGLQSQVRALSEYCRLNNIKNAELFTDENVSGAKSSRPALDRMMESVRKKEVDKVICYSLSGLGRSTTHLLKIMEELNQCGTKFVSLCERIETETPAGRMIFTVLAACSQLERELIVERVKNGLANARAKGVKLGREKKRDSDLIRKLHASGLSYRAISTIAKCSHGSVSAEVASLKKEKAALLAEQSEKQTLSENKASNHEIQDDNQTKTVFFDLSDQKAT